VPELGRSSPTYRRASERIIQEWRGFRRALCPEDREAFDRLLEHVRDHAAAGSSCDSPDPVESMLMSMLLEHEKELRRLRREER